MAYNFTAIEAKWQKHWLENRTFRALDPDEAGERPQMYILDMFPYPSGAGLHVGHAEQQIATDILTRYKRMRRVNVLHPIGWDAFGLPAEQYAIKTNTHPRETTRKNIDNFRSQIRMLGISYDWDREINTTDPAYYKWTQWIFLQMFNSYYDPIDDRARPIGHLMQELLNENLVVAPDGQIVINPTQEGMEPISGEIRVERLWRELSDEEQREVLDAQRLAYMDEVPVNWCPALGTVLANEEVIDGRSEVGGFPVERRPMRQWMLRITAYAERLLADLDGLDWPESIKDMQRNWIGKSVGAEIEFRVVPPEGSNAAGQRPGDAAQDAEDELTITVFTTRPDTLYGATYMVLAPEHPMVDRITPESHRETIEAYREMAAGKSDRERMAEVKQKSGVFTGAYAINPVNDEKIPVYIADYVLMGYGTGAIMAVPAHDERDFDFAKQHNLPIRPVVQPRNSAQPITDQAFVEDGIAINSPVIDGLPTPEAKERIVALLDAEDVAYRSVKYKLRDWLFCRQRYWGEPFPILWDEEGNAYPVDEEELPVTLPEMQDFKPTGTPEPPLSKVKDWVEVEIDGRKYHRETNTMPQWAGSCWYYLRYLDPKNDERLVGPEKERYWMPVDLYVGGVEHAVLHLLYARFWHKVLYDLEQVSTPEPFARLVNQGLILGEMEFHVFETADGRPVSTTDVQDIEEEATAERVQLVAAHKQTRQKLIGRRLAEKDVEKSGDSYSLRGNQEIRVDARSFKMSKSRGNVVNPDDIVRDYGADTFRLYEMYLGPLEAQKPWNTRDIVGMSRFLNSVWRNIIGDDEPELLDLKSEMTNLKSKLSDQPIPDLLDRRMHRAIKKVGEDIENLRFNTAIAELIKLNNEMSKLDAIPRRLAEIFTLLLAPFAPHIAEEIWTRMGHRQSLADHPWPAYDQARLVESVIEVPVQVNGRLRGRISILPDASEQTVLDAAQQAEAVRPWLEGKTIRKRIYVEKKLVNFVVA